MLLHVLISEVLAVLLGIIGVTVLTWSVLSHLPGYGQIGIVLFLAATYVGHHARAKRAVIRDLDGEISRLLK